MIFSLIFVDFTADIIQQFGLLYYSEIANNLNKMLNMNFSFVCYEIRFILILKNSVNNRGLFMKQKQLTHQQFEKKALRKQKEIAKWEKEKARPKRSYYIIYLIFIVSLIYVTDETASQIGTLIKTEIANDLMSSFGKKASACLIQSTLLPFLFRLCPFFINRYQTDSAEKYFLLSTRSA